MERNRIRRKNKSNFLFRTALSKSILPFGLYNPDLVVLPIKIEQSKQKKIHLYSAEQLMTRGSLEASAWFNKVEKEWNKNKTAKSDKMSNLARLNFQNGITEQRLDIPYLVLYNSSAKDANATIVKRSDLDLEFIVESKTYWFGTTNLKEAYYLTAILNSSVPNELMKDFQTRGLYGPRDVHKRILDIYYPKFNEENEIHISLAELGELSHEKVSQWLKNNTLPEAFTSIKLGSVRLQIKNHLAKEMKDIDKLVKKLLKQKSNIIEEMEK